MVFIFLYAIIYVQAESTAAKIEDLISEMLRFINSECQTCQFSSDHFGLLQFVCEQPGTSSDFASLQGRVVGTYNISSSKIIDLLQQWVNTSPLVLIGGARYTVTAQCAVLIDDIDTSSCTETLEANTVENETGGSLTLVLAITALVISIVDMALMAIGVIAYTVMHIRGKRMK